MSVYGIIENNPFNPVHKGVCERLSDGNVFIYTQSEHEKRMGWGMLYELDPENIPISDYNCTVSGLPFESRFVRSLPGCYDLNYGFKILT